jgi:hypothetical protein
VSAGVTQWNFYFRLSPEPISSRHMVESWEHRPRHLPGMLLMMRKGLPSHRSPLVKDIVANQQERLAAAFLPSRNIGMAMVAALTAPVRLRNVRRER